MCYSANVSDMSGAWRRSLIAAACCLLLTACASQVIYGADPNTDALGRLVLGESTETDIRRIIGTPRGRGEALWSMDMTKRKLLFYEKVRSDGRAVDLKMLLILLKDGRYDGHLWFSSTDMLKLEGY